MPVAGMRRRALTITVDVPTFSAAAAIAFDSSTNTLDMFAPCPISFYTSIVIHSLVDIRQMTRLGLEKGVGFTIERKNAGFMTLREQNGAYHREIIF